MGEPCKLQVEYFPVCRTQFFYKTHQLYVLGYCLSSVFGTNEGAFAAESGVLLQTSGGEP